MQVKTKFKKQMNKYGYKKKKKKDKFQNRLLLN